MRSPALARRGAALLAFVASASLFACIIAEPVSDLPVLPSFRPVIVRSSTVPQPSAVLGVFPDKFVVPVELVDPGVTLSWRLYVDYNPITGEGLVSFEDGLRATSADRTRVLEVQTGPRPDPSRCHVVEFIVAQQFQVPGGLGGKNARTPVDPPGGDAVTWIYSPGGDLRGCPVADAGVPDARLPDAGDAEGGS
jgi:hypothetical protein